MFHLCANCRVFPIRPTYPAEFETAAKESDYNLPTSMPKSPRMVPGLDFNGSVAPSISRPISTIFLPSHTYNETNTLYHLPFSTSHTTYHTYTTGTRIQLTHKNGEKLHNLARDVIYKLKMLWMICRHLALKRRFSQALNEYYQ